MLKRDLILKLFSASLILVVACSSPLQNNPGSSNISDTLKNGLVLYLPFEGNANDLSGNNNNGTVFGKVNFETGKIGKAASFTSINNGEVADDTYILVKNSEKLSLKKTFSISAWAFSKEKPEGSYYPIVTKGKVKEDYTMWFTSGGVDLLLNWSTDNEQWGHVDNEKNEKISENKWINMIVTYDGKNIKYYNDGVKTKTFDFNKNLDNSNEDLYIAASFPGGMEVFNGLLDEIRIYDRALTDNEIKALAEQK